MAPFKKPPLKIPARKPGETLIPTLNKMGYMTSTIDVYSQEFIDYASHIQAPCLEIGAAYGIVALEALKAGAAMIVNDLDPDHLELLKGRITSDMRSPLKFIAGKFPEDVDLEPGSLGAVFSSRVFHFFTPCEIEESLKKIFRLLAPQGKLFLVCETPYLRNYRDFIPVFEGRKSRGEAWPGLIEDAAQYNHQRTAHLPKLMHFFDDETLEKTVARHGFVVEKVGMFSRCAFPADIRLDGRESVGLIAHKPPL